MTGLNRRRLLKTLGASSVTVGLAGCLGGDEDDGTPRSTSAPGATTMAEPTTRTDASKPETLPPRSALDLYSAESPLNQQIPADAAIDPDSAGYVDLLARTGESEGFAIELKQYSAPVYFADANTPRRDVWLACGSTWWLGVEYLRDVPIPAFAEPAQDGGGGRSLPAGRCGQNSPLDNQMIVLDPETRCEYDFWQMRMEDDGWVASWANSISMDSIGIYEKDFSARGSGFTTLSGLIWPDELENERIEHALIFSYPHSKSGGPVPPATESDGTSGKRYALPEGARVRLDPTVDVEGLGLPAVERTIATALQEYGMFLVDVGGSGISTEAVDPRSVTGFPYEGLLPDVDFPVLEDLPLERLEVLELPAQNPNADDESELVPSGCGYME